MKKISLVLSLIACAFALFSQQTMTPEMLWSLGRVSSEMITPDGKNIIYGVTYFDKEANKGERNLYSISVNGGAAKKITHNVGAEYNVLTLPNGKMGYLYKGQLWQSEWDGTQAIQITEVAGGLDNVQFSPNKKFIAFTREVKTGKNIHDLHPDLQKANVYVINDLMYRHWDSWSDDLNSHLFYAEWNNGNLLMEQDIMVDEPFDCPTKPFGGLEDYCWSPDSKSIVYVAKKLTGKEYAISTNKDIYIYNVQTAKTKNLTSGMQGYDTRPVFSPDGKWLAFLSMQQNGNEADKNRMMVMNLSNEEVKDLSGLLDETVDELHWSQDGKTIYFLSPNKGVISLFAFDFDGYIRGLRKYPITQIIDGQFDITGIFGTTEKEVLVARTDMNHAVELYKIDFQKNELQQITATNDSIYNSISLSKIEHHWIKTTDNKEMLVWVILPPNFDPSKKYPTLLYCQGGPQTALSQFYSFRWNFQLMAAQGYVVIAPNRRGMPGHGVEWNAAISKDWGGQPIRDYISAIDWAKAELSYVDDDLCAAVGASYGGYSVYMLAGMHEGRFKSFIAHDGLFNLTSFYGTTEEMFFANWDLGGPYWESGIQNASFNQFNPINYVQKWDTPILIIQGGKDFRTTEDQAFQAFNAAQLRGIKSRFIYLPEENHWVLSCQNALAWQREFFKWLDETLE